MRAVDKQILLVDDSSAYRAELRDLIAQLGHSVCAEASDGRAALRLYEYHRPALVLMDVIMPRMDGITTLQRIRRMDPAACVVLMCAARAWETALATQTLGARFFLYKPCERAVLGRVFGALLRDAEDAGPRADLT